MTTSDPDAPIDNSGCPPVGALGAYLHGEMDDEQALEHIESCDMCARRLDEMTQINAFLSGLVLNTGGAVDSAHGGGVPDAVAGLTFRKEIGRGGQGVVYEALQEETNRIVAVKALRHGAMATEGQLARFRREIRLVASLDHNNIVTIHDVVDLPQGRLAFVMQRIEGETLKVWLERLLRDPLTRRHSARMILTVFEKIARAVSYAHSKGVIHRDLKPGNVLVDIEHEPHILDFGIACAPGEAIDTQGQPKGRHASWDTRTNEFVGSLHYAAPEQLTPGASVDVRTDVYALGVMLASAVDQFNRHDPALMFRDQYDDVDWIIARATAKSPDARYPSASAFADDLARLIERRPVSAHPKTLPYTIHRLIQRRPGAAIALASITILAVVIALLGLSQLNRITEQGIELDRAGYLSSIDRANSLIESGSYLNAEALLWDAVLTGPPGDGTDVVGIDGPALTSPALWGLRSLYARQPSLGSFNLGAAKTGERRLLTFDESGSRLFILNTQGTLETWDWRMQSLRRSVQLTGEPIVSMVSAPGSSFVAVVTQRDSHRLILFDMTSGEPVGEYDFSAILDSSRDVLPEITISRGAERLAIGTGSNVLLIDRIKNQTLQIESRGTRAIASLDFDSPADRLLITGAETAFEVRDAETGGLLAAARYPGQYVQGGRVKEGWFLPGDAQLMFQGSDLFIYDQAVGKSHPVSWHNLAYDQRTLDPESGWVATAFTTEIMVRRMAGDGEQVRILQGHRSSVHSLALHGDSEILASLDAKGVIRFWDLSGSLPARIIRTSSATVFSVDASPDGKRIYSGDSGGDLRAWNWHDGAEIQGAIAHLDGMISRIAVSPDGQYVAIGGGQDFPRLLILSLQTGQTLLDLRSLESRVTGLSFSPDGQSLAVAAGLDCIVVGLTADGEPGVRRVSVDPRIKGLDFTRDGKAIVCTDTIGAFSLDADTLMKSGHVITPDSAPRHIAASPLDDVIVVDGDDSTLRVFDRNSGHAIGKLVGHALRDHWMDFHPSGELLLSAGEDGVLKLWDMRTMRCLATFNAHGAPIFCARFIPGGLRAVTGDTRGRIGLWDFAALDQYIAGNLEAAVARHGEDTLQPERLRRLRGWAKSLLTAN